VAVNPLQIDYEEEWWLANLSAESNSHGERSWFYSMVAQSQTSEQEYADLRATKGVCQHSNTATLPKSFHEGDRHILSRGC